jgi:erythronate-4-phosphate dehydrogenase
VHVPLEYEGDHPTFHLCGSEFFRKMKDGAVFINSSRGEAVDTSSLLDALKSGRISKCALDVWENEPDIDRELMTLARFSTPHIAGYSTDGKANGTAMSVRSLTAFFGIPGFEDFFPQNVPQALNSDAIFLDERMSDAEQIRRAVLHTYNIADDDWKLKSFTEQFEKLRGNYPIRREFTSYTVKGASAEAGKVLAALGFKVD